MQVKDVMKTDVKTTVPDSTVQEAAEKMSQNRIGCLIVVEKDRMMGIITERDILTRLVAEDLTASETRVDKIMTTEVVIIGPDREVSDAAEIMVKRKIKKLPVISEDRLVGIVTLFDMCSVEPELIKKASSLMAFPDDKKKIIAG
jgi:CBS domain-containing protein